MASRPVALLLADLGIAKSHSRPHTSNDNPYSEAHFKILKYRPGFPARFGSIEDARAFCQRFFPWYNTEHRHSGIGLMTPAIVHAGLAPEVQVARAITLSQACVSPGLTGSGSRVPDPAGHLRLSGSGDVRCGRARRRHDRRVHAGPSRRAVVPDMRPDHRMGIPMGIQPVRRGPASGPGIARSERGRVDFVIQRRSSSVVEQGTHKPLVGGSNPPSATNPPRAYGDCRCSGL